MTSFKDNLSVQSQGAVVGVQEQLFSIKNWFNNLPSFVKVVIVLLLILATLGTVVARYGTEQYLVLQYKKQALLSHASYSNPENVSVGPVSLINNPTGTYTAYSVVANPNLDLGTSEALYTFTFYNSAREQVYTTTGKTYFSPNEKKWIVVPRIETSQVITSGTITFSPINWQKKLNTLQVELRMVQPYVYEVVNPLTVAVEGAVVNNSPYTIAQARLVFVFYNDKNDVIAVTQRDESTLEAFERRAYKLQLPGLYRADIARVDMQAYTNTFDPKNVTVNPNAQVAPDTVR